LFLTYIQEHICM